MKIKFLIIALIFSHYFAHSQVEDAWLYFKDKENVTYLLDNPGEILSQQALDRKERQGISIDERDVPVNENYISQVKQVAGISVLAKSKWFNAIHVIGSETDLNALISLTFVDHIEYADKSKTSSTSYNPVKDKFEIETNKGVSLNYGNTQNQVEMIGVDHLHDENLTGESVIVAILDSGFPNVDRMSLFSRLRDDGRLLGGYDFVDRTNDIYVDSGHFHGTEVLSTMAAYEEDIYIGTAPDASYYLFRTEDAGSESIAEESYWVEAAERADSLGVDIINSSLGYREYTKTNYSHSASDLDGYSTFITRGANMAFEKGILVVNSAGNSGAIGVVAPADSPYVVSVGSVTSSGDYSYFSSRGSENQPTLKPNVCAQGTLAYVINKYNSVAQNSGTSFSSPITAGALACLKQAFPYTSNQELIDKMQQSASQYSNPDYFLGYGIPDFESALEVLSQKYYEPIADIKIYPNPFNENLTVDAFKISNGFEVILYDLIGKQVYKAQIKYPTQTINTSQLAGGMYIALIKSNSETKTIKLIKK